MKCIKIGARNHFSLYFIFLLWIFLNAIPLVWQTMHCLTKIVLYEVKFVSIVMDKWLKIVALCLCIYNRFHHVESVARKMKDALA